MSAALKPITPILIAIWFAFRDVATAAELKVLPIGELSAKLYDYSLRVVGLSVFVMFLLAGLAYMIPPLKKKVGDPLNIIKDAVIGLIILVSAFVVLNTISPSLVGSP